MSYPKSICKPDPSQVRHRAIHWERLLPPGFDELGIPDQNKVLLEIRSSLPTDKYGDPDPRGCTQTLQYHLLDYVEARRERGSADEIAELLGTALTARNRWRALGGDHPEVSAEAAKRRIALAEFTDAQESLIKKVYFYVFLAMQFVLKKLKIKGRQAKVFFDLMLSSAVLAVQRCCTKNNGRSKNTPVQYIFNQIKKSIREAWAVEQPNRTTYKQEKVPMIVRGKPDPEPDVRQTYNNLTRSPNPNDPYCEFEWEQWSTEPIYCDPEPEDDDIAVRAVAKHLGEEHGRLAAYCLRQYEDAPQNKEYKQPSERATKAATGLGETKIRRIKNEIEQERRQWANLIRGWNSGALN